MHSEIKRKKINSCKSAIIKTLSYSGVFGYPLTFYQITNNLISKNNFPRRKIKKELEELIKNGAVKKIKGRYVVSGIKTHDAEKRAKISRRIMDENRSVAKTLAKIPWIKMIAATGSVANYDADEKADIDLLFITEKNRLWISRGFVFLMLKTMGKLPKNRDKRKICPNIFIDESKLGWVKKKRNLFIAQNIISMQPLVWRDNIYFDFMKKNNWVFKYFGNFKVNLPHNGTKKNIKDNVLFKALESLAKKMQISYMGNGITTEVLSDELIHFNKKDVSKKVLRKYKEISKNTLKML